MRWGVVSDGVMRLDVVLLRGAAILLYQSAQPAQLERDGHILALRIEVGANVVAALRLVQRTQVADGVQRISCGVRDLQRVQRVSVDALALVRRHFLVLVQNVQTRRLWSHAQNTSPWSEPARFVSCSWRLTCAARAHRHGTKQCEKALQKAS